MITVAAGQVSGAGMLVEPKTEYQQTYLGQADQVRNVRHDVAHYLGECPVADDTVLIASELSTNAILHSRSRGGHFTICVKLYRNHVRVECQDTGGPWRSSRKDIRPHGLAIVDALTGPGRWGIERTRGHTRVVWATLEWS